MFHGDAKTNTEQAAADKSTMDLMVQIAHQPELMSMRYLNYVIGLPQPDTTNGMGPNKHYRWYDVTTNQLRFELIQVEAAPGRIIKSKLIANTPYLDEDLAKIESDYGVAPTKFFDQQASPNIKYSFAPWTTVDFMQPHNSFHVSQTTVAYSGYALPPLTNQELQQAMDFHRNLAFQHQKNGKYDKAIPALRQTVAENPSDVDARLALAEALQKHSNINDAITEYRTLLSMNPDPQTTQRCVKGLQQMRVIPDENGLPQQKLLKLVNHGQGLQESDPGDNGALNYPGPGIQGQGLASGSATGYDAGVGF